MKCPLHARDTGVESRTVHGCENMAGSSTRGERAREMGFGPTRQGQRNPNRRSVIAPPVDSNTRNGTGSLGPQEGLGRGRQNERDRVMTKDPLVNFEEVVYVVGPQG